jgi:hypothetical protein
MTPKKFWGAQPIKWYQHFTKPSDLEQLVCLTNFLWDEVVRARPCSGSLRFSTSITVADADSQTTPNCDIGTRQNTCYICKLQIMFQPSFREEGGRSVMPSTRLHTIPRCRMRGSSRRQPTMGGSAARTLGEGLTTRTKKKVCYEVINRAPGGVLCTRWWSLGSIKGGEFLD